MPKYYFIDSNGENTNLQLFALKQAKIKWNELYTEIKEYGQAEFFHERCVYIICTMGLSLSQLLGQNNPQPCDKVPSPKVIFANIVRKNNLHRSLIDKFNDFIDAYDKCRHFGVTTNHERHYEVSKINFERTQDLYEFGLLVWNIIIDLYKKDPSNKIDELDIGEVEYDPFL